MYNIFTEMNMLHVTVSCIRNESCEQLVRVRLDGLDEIFGCGGVFAG
jgi:hypothetical protein